MSLMGTLAKVAIGVAVAKGAGSLLKGAQNRQAGQTGQAGNGGLFGGEYSPQANQQGGGLEDLMGSILGGAQQPGTSAGGGLGGLLESLAGGQQGQRGGMNDMLRRQPQQRGGGGLQDLLGGLAGDQGKSMGGGGLLGGILGSVLGGQNRQGGFGDMLNQSIQQRGEPMRKPSREQNAMAGLMLRAMIMAAKSDGKFDAAEQEKIAGNLGDISPEERAFVNQEMQAPVDPHGLAEQTPRGMEQQLYAMSVMGIDLDNQNEAEYLHTLAQALELDERTVNAIHQKFGAPELYR